MFYVCVCVFMGFIKPKHNNNIEYIYLHINQEKNNAKKIKKNNKCKKVILKIPKEYSEAVNRRTDNAMTKYKRLLRNIIQLQRTI